jgi:toxin ParE1/3/4
MTRQKWRVAWAEPAIVDLEETVSFIASRSPLNAKRLLKNFKTKARSLENSPERGRVVAELAEFGIRAWRELLIRPYRLIYRVRDKNTVLVAAFLDGRRDLRDVLLERLTRSE